MRLLGIIAVLAFSTANAAVSIVFIDPRSGPV